MIRISGNRPRLFMQLLILALPAWLSSSVLAVDRISIGDAHNNSFLRYGLDTVMPDVFIPERVQIHYPIATFRSGRGNSTPPIFGTVLNPATGTESTADFTLRTYPDLKYFDEVPIKLTISDFGFYRAGGRSLPGVAIGGYRNDTAFVVRILVGDTTRLFIPVSHGVDQDQDHVWRGNPSFVWASDFDGDGHEEVFFWVDPVRDIGPRDLVCLDLDAGKVRWSFPVASGIFRGQLFSMKDSTGPLLVFSAYGMGQGARDDHFYSSFGYVGIVDQNGKLLHSRIAAKFGDEIAVLKLSGDTLFALEHTLPLDSSEVGAEADSSHYRISLVDRNLHIVKSVLFDKRLTTPWLSDYDGDGKDEIYTLTVDGIIRIYDQSLALLGESPPSSLKRLITALPNWDVYDNAFIFETPRGSEVYSHDFHKLSSLDTYAFYSPLAYDANGRMTAFVASLWGHFSVGRVARRNWVHLVSVVYQEYQIWVLSVLFSLAVGLIVMNFYRRRVSRQRRALSLAHVELAETHEALKQAQATIITQEKYRQAKDIAGAFAHEIRNSLFPADSALTKMVQLGDLTEADPQRVSTLRESIRTAVSRAVSITEQISTYTKLDTLYSPERVNLRQLLDEVVKAHKLILADARIQVSLVGPNDCDVFANRAQLSTVFSNLLLNSLYALKGSPAPEVAVAWHSSDDVVEISFADNGTGIPADQLGRIFDTFFSTKPSTGTGLGLATSKKIVEMYQGTISVSSEPTRGATFTIRLKIPCGERSR